MYIHLSKKKDNTYRREFITEYQSTFARNPLLAEAPNPYYDWLRSVNLEKCLYLSCNKAKGGKKAICSSRQIYAAIDIQCYYFYCTYSTFLYYVQTNLAHFLNIDFSLIYTFI